MQQVNRKQKQVKAECPEAPVSECSAGKLSSLKHCKFVILPEEWQILPCWQALQVPMPAFQAMLQLQNQNEAKCYTPSRRVADTPVLARPMPAIRAMLQLPNQTVTTMTW